MDLTILSNMAMTLLLIGTLPSIAAVVRNRKSLGGFSAIGAVGIAGGQAMYMAYFFMLGDYVTTLLCVPLVAFWLLVVLFKARK